MFVITHAQELFYLLSGIGIFAVCVSLTWFLILAIITIQDARSIVSKINTTINIIQNVSTTVQQKINSAHVQFGLLSEGIKALLSFVKQNTSNTKSTAQKKRTSKKIN